MFGLCYGYKGANCEGGLKFEVNWQLFLCGIRGTGLLSLRPRDLAKLKMSMDSCNTGLLDLGRVCVGKLSTLSDASAGITICPITY